MKISNIVQDSYSDSNIYKYSASLRFVLGQESYEIDSLYIKSIAIDSDYKNTNMPMVFVTASIRDSIIDKMVNNQDTGMVIMDIRRANANSDMPDLFVEYINDTFSYFISEDYNKDDLIDTKFEEFDDNPNADRSSIVSIGLLSLNHINKNKKPINGVVNGDLMSIIYYTLQDMPVLIEPLAKSVQISNMFIPPMNSIAKTLKYLNSLNAFYNTPYRFFIDFNCTYLLSSSGDIVRKKDEKISSVSISLHPETDVTSRLKGMITDDIQATYKIDIDGADCELVDNNYTTTKSYSKISAAYTSGQTKEGNLANKPKKSVIVDKTKFIRIANDNSRLLDNIISESDSCVRLLVQKTDIDSSVLTMNKEYNITADELYKTDKYNGKYILTRKRDLYIREGELFVLNTMLLLEKVM